MEGGEPNVVPPRRGTTLGFGTVPRLGHGGGGAWGGVQGVG